MKTNHRSLIALQMTTLALAGLAACSDRSTELTTVRGPTRADAVAPPNPPIIWLHYDYMVAPDHSHAPTAQTIETLRAVFRARGITVHIDPRHDEIPESDCLVYDVLRPEYEPQCALYGGRTLVSWFDLKSRYFNPRGSQPWHYAIFAHHGCYLYGCGYFGGLAEIRGFDFLVTLGTGFWHELVTPEVRERWLPSFEIGTLLHELGHNLGLVHGGDKGEEQNWKPNYVSIMNYAYSHGIVFSAVPGSIDSAGVRFDYSDEVLPPLDERHLDERIGLGLRSTVIVPYACLPPGGTTPDGWLFPNGPAAGPIDWDCNGIIESDVSQDLNLTGFCAEGYPCYQVLTGYNDWAHIHAFLRTPEYVTGKLRSRGVIP